MTPARSFSRYERSIVAARPVGGSGSMAPLKFRMSVTFVGVLIWVCLFCFLCSVCGVVNTRGLSFPFFFERVRQVQLTELEKTNE